MSLRPKTISVEFGDDTVELRQLSRSQLKELMTLEEHERADRMLLLSVFQHGKPLFANAQETGDISLEAALFLDKEIVAFNGLDAKKN